MNYKVVVFKENNWETIVNSKNYYHCFDYLPKDTEHVGECKYISEFTGKTYMIIKENI